MCKNFGQFSSLIKANSNMYSHNQSYQNNNNSIPLRVSIVTSNWDKMKGVMWMVGLAGLGYLYWNYSNDYSESSSTSSSSSSSSSVSKAHSLSTNIETRFSDVKGVDEAKVELEEVVEYLKNGENLNDWEQNYRKEFY